MPITKSAKKAVRVSARRKTLNEHTKRVMKEVVKQIQKLSRTDKEKAKATLSSAYALIDKAAKKGVIKKNNASRKKSRLARILK